MPSDYSFDCVSDVDLNLVSEVVAVALKEITNRFDMKDANASIELNAKDKKLFVRASNEFKVEQVYDVLLTRLAKRGLPIKNLTKGKIEAALGAAAKMEVGIQSGIPTDKAKLMQAAIKEHKLKVNAQIQDGQLRVSSKSKDELQATMNVLKAGKFDLDLQFKNFR
ncbi:MAG: YajQ family cyclic di-GMP-binding protein [Elusimicrobiota bacterium]|nr:MAG: YajQ family cyclic di-GMP-binding protein [Elusimicrobiota bacterium]